MAGRSSASTVFIWTFRAIRRPVRHCLRVTRSKNYNNLSNWLLHGLGLDGKEILYNKTSGKLKSLGFRALAHLCIIIYPNITKNKISDPQRTMARSNTGIRGFSITADRRRRFSCHARR